jgi:hypothetical protein
MRNTS